MVLGPGDIEPRDIVCILLGSQVPSLLQAIDSYVLLGECYCHAIMEGEAVRQLDQGKAKLRDFTIR